MHTTRMMIGLAVLFAWPVVAADRTHDIQLEDYFSLSNISGCAISPDGMHVAYTEVRWQGEDERTNTDLWVVDVQSREVRRLTFDKAGVGSPTWSPDSRHIYYTSGRRLAGEKEPPLNGKNQVWRISRDGGEPFAVTRVADGVGSFELSKDGKSLYYTVSEEHTEDEWKDLRGKYKDLQYGHGVEKFTQLHKLDLTNWRSEKLIDEKRVITTFAVAPDEAHIAMITTPDSTLLTNEGWSRVDLYNAAAKEVSIITEDGWRDDHPSPYGWIDYGLSWSADSKAIVFTVSFDGYPPDIYAAELMGDGPMLWKVRRPTVTTVHGGTARFVGKKRVICYLGEWKARVGILAISAVREGKQDAFLEVAVGDVAIRSFSFPEHADKPAMVMATTTHPPDVFLVKGPPRDFERLTNVNPQVDTWKLPSIEIVKWIGADGDEVEGILELPPDYGGSEPLPLIVEIHGGPTAATLLELRFWIYGRTLMAAKGYALLSPNYHGSTGYGDEFMIDLIGRENEIEITDILTGVDAMVERGIADPDRLAVMGWSNGGFLTNSIITKTDRFKAASSGAGVIDMVIQWGTEDTPGHVVNFMKGSLPWSNTEEYIKASPLYELDKVTTPTLIHVGENDPRVPAAHSRALYRGLRHYLHVPTELVVYPGEGHGLTVYKHRKAKMEWDHAWFDKYLLGKGAEDEAADPKPEESDGARHEAM